jgi:hypothetical protein
MFIVKPLARNTVTPVPFPFNDITNSTRYITTHSLDYVINDSSVLFIRLSNSSAKQITLPIGVNGRLIIIQDIGGNSSDSPCTIKVSDCAFSDHATEKVFTSGPFLIALRFNDSTYDVASQRHEWNTEYLLIGDQPSLVPKRDNDTIIEGIDGDMLIIAGNPNEREIVISKPSIPAGESTYPELFFTVIDGADTAGDYPITIRFNGTRMNGNPSLIMTGNSAQITFRSLPDGTYQYVTSTGGTFSSYAVPFIGKCFGYVSEQNPFYNTITRGFTNLDGNVGGTFLSNGV